jgi:hypothetical protein
MRLDGNEAGELEDNRMRKSASSAFLRGSATGPAHHKTDVAVHLIIPQPTSLSRSPTFFDPHPSILGNLGKIANNLNPPAPSSYSQ